MSKQGDNIKAQIGAGVRQHRARHDMTQVELARAARLNRTYISRLERGRAMPTADVLVRLAKALGVTVTDIVGA